MKLVALILGIGLLLATSLGVSDTADAKGGHRGPQQQLIVAPTCAVDTSFTLAAGASEVVEISGCEALTYFTFTSRFAHPGQETTPFDATETNQRLTITAPNGTVYCAYPVCDDTDDVSDLFIFNQNGMTMGEFGSPGIWVFRIDNIGTQSLNMTVLAGGT